MQSLLLCSSSPIKLEAVKAIFPNCNVTCMNAEINIPPQPFDSGKECAHARLKYCKAKAYPMTYDYYVAIENELHKRYALDQFVDIAQVVIEHKSILVNSDGDIGVDVPKIYFDKLHKHRNLCGYLFDGFDKTLGEIIQEENPSVDPKNWMLTLNNVNRVDQIKSSLSKALIELARNQVMVKQIINKYALYPNYPKLGVVFQDFFSILREYDNIEYIMDTFDRYQWDYVDYVIGPETRGFFGILASVKLNVGFIPIRKAGKLPGVTDKVEYSTEYSKDVLEIQKNIPKDSKILIFDDLIATGGSLRACCDLVEKQGCVIVDCVVLREVTALKEQAKKTMNRSYTVLLQD